MQRDDSTQRPDSTGGQIFENPHNITDLEWMLVLIPFRALMKSGQILLEESIPEMVHYFLNFFP